MIVTRVRSALSADGRFFSVQFAKQKGNESEVVSQSKSSQIPVCLFQSMAEPAIILVITFFLFFGKIAEIRNDITEHTSSPLISITV